MSSILLFDIISVVLLRCPDPKIFLCIPASAADAVAVNPKGIKTLLASPEILVILSSLITGFLIT